VIAGRAEQAALIVTTNLPFSEWPTKIPNARLCKAMLDRFRVRHAIGYRTQADQEPRVAHNIVQTSNGQCCYSALDGPNIGPASLR